MSSYLTVRDINSVAALSSLKKSWEQNKKSYVSSIKTFAQLLNDKKRFASVFLNDYFASLDAKKCTSADVYISAIDSYVERYNGKDLFAKVTAPGVNNIKSITANAADLQAFNDQFNKLVVAKTSTSSSPAAVASPSATTTTKVVTAASAASAKPCITYVKHDETIVLDSHCADAFGRNMVEAHTKAVAYLKSLVASYDLISQYVECLDEKTIATVAADIIKTNESEVSTAHIDTFKYDVDSYSEELSAALTGLCDFKTASKHISKWYTESSPSADASAASVVEFSSVFTPVVGESKFHFELPRVKTVFVKESVKADAAVADVYNKCSSWSLRIRDQPMPEDLKTLVTGMFKVELNDVLVCRQIQSFVAQLESIDSLTARQIENVVMGETQSVVSTKDFKIVFGDASLYTNESGVTCNLESFLDASASTPVFSVVSSAELCKYGIYVTSKTVKFACEKMSSNTKNNKKVSLADAEVVLDRLIANGGEGKTAVALSKRIKEIVCEESEGTIRLSDLKSMSLSEEKLTEEIARMEVQLVKLVAPTDAAKIDALEKKIATKKRSLELCKTAHERYAAFSAAKPEHARIIQKLSTVKDVAGAAAPAVDEDDEE